MRVVTILVIVPQKCQSETPLKLLIGPTMTQVWHTLGFLDFQCQLVVYRFKANSFLQLNALDNYLVSAHSVRYDSSNGQT